MANKMVDINILGVTFIKDYDFVKGYVISVRPKFKELVIQVRHFLIIIAIEKRIRDRRFFKCYDCDGRGWLPIEEPVDDEDRDTFYLKTFMSDYYVLCTACDGKGHGW